MLPITNNLVNEAQTNFTMIPRPIQVIILKMCSTRGRIAAGATCKNVHELVNGKLSDDHTRLLWNDKISLLESRKHWGIRTDPETVTHLFRNLNALVMILGTGVFLKRDYSKRKKCENFSNAKNNFYAGNNLSDQDDWHLKDPLHQSVVFPPCNLPNPDEYVLEAHWRTHVKNHIIERAKNNEWATMEIIWPLLIVDTIDGNELKKLAGQVFPHARDSEGMGLLHLASKAGKVDLVRALILKGKVPLEQETYRGNSPLTLASLNGHLPVVKVLIEEFDANVHHQNDSGRNCLDNAASSKSIDITKYLLSIIPNPEKSLFNALKNTDENEQNKALITLIEAGINWEYVNQDGKNIFLLLCEKGNLVVTKFLLERGADKEINSFNKDGRTPLIIACEKGHFDLARLLLEKGADKVINSPDAKGRTPLMLACEKGNIDLAKLLLENGAEKTINNRDLQDKSALQYSAARQNKLLTALLIERGASAAN